MTATLERRRPLIGPNGPLVDPNGATLYSAVTPGGIPYPAPTDPVSQGAANMTAIATFLDPAELALIRSTPVNFNSGLWTANPPPGWTGSPLVQKGTGIVVSGGGAQVTAAGRYRVDYVGNFAANATGRRGVTVGSATASFAYLGCPRRPIRPARALWPSR